MNGRALEQVSDSTTGRSEASIWWIRIAKDPVVRRRIILMLFAALVGLFAHIAFLVLLPAKWRINQSTDYVGYYAPVAENIISNKGLVFASKPALQYPPGLPFLYAVTFSISDVATIDRAVGLRILQALFVISTSVMIGMVSLRLFSLRVAMAAVVMWSTYPFQLWLTKQPDASSVLTTLLLSAVLLFMLWSNQPAGSVYYGLAVGGVLAIAALLKPICIALPIVFVCLASLCSEDAQLRRRWLFSLSVVVAYVSLLLPWEVWAWRASGHVVPLCINGPNALIDGLTFGTVRGLRPISMPAPVHVLVQDAVTHYQNLKTTSNIVHFIITQVQERPISVIELFLLKAVRSWYGSESHSFEKAVAIIQLCYLPLVVLGVRRTWGGSREQRVFLVVTMGIVMYFWAMTVFTAMALLRYMIPGISVLSVCAANVIGISKRRRLTAFLVKHVT